MNHAHQAPAAIPLPEEPNDGRMLLELAFALLAKARAAEQAQLAHYRNPWSTRRFDCR